MSSASPAQSPTNADGQPSLDEVARLRRRRKLARKTPQQRRKLLQYQRRHNEKDGRLFYCDYCDLFISSRPKPWAAHLGSARHMNAFRYYYELAEHVESVWLGEINYKIDQARSREVHRVQQAKAGAGAATPLTACCVAPGIVVGGSVAPPPPPPAAAAAAAAAVAVGVHRPLPFTGAPVMGAVKVMPSITVGGKVVLPPPPPPPPSPS